MAKAPDVLKVSRRDYPLVIAKQLDGATTVAGTMIAASMAGIKLFVTGGIGGVHRGAGESFDISADLEELKKTGVAVVCAGVKSILDIGAVSYTHLYCFRRAFDYGYETAGYGRRHFAVSFRYGAVSCNDYNSNFQYA